MAQLYTEQELRGLQSEICHLTEVFDLIPDHVVITDVNGIILYGNKGAEHRTGFSAEEMIGKKPGDLWGGQMDKSFYENMWKIIKEDKTAFVGEVENRRKDGTTYWQELHVYPVLGEDSEVKFFIGIEPDITIRKAEEGVEAQYVEELERVNKYLSGRVAKLSELAEEFDKFKSDLLRKN